MEKIIWTPELSVGVDVFDEQHKQVVLMINRLIDAQEAETNSQTVSDLLDKMTRYAGEHLKAEEKMMAAHGYPLFEPHRAQHMAYIKKTVAFCTATQLGVDAIPKGLLAYLHDWWEQHILHTDRAYMAFFNDIGIE
jgi:hemerythrin